MRISDWSSDVCSSDLARRSLHQDRLAEAVGEEDHTGDPLIRQVVDLAERLPDLGNGLESVGGVGHLRSLGPHLTARSIRFVDAQVRVWPSPLMTNLSVVSSRRPMGPRAWSLDRKSTRLNSSH